VDPGALSCDDGSWVKFTVFSLSHSLTRSGVWSPDRYDPRVLAFPCIRDSHSDALSILTSGKRVRCQKATITFRNCSTPIAALFRSSSGAS